VSWARRFWLREHLRNALWPIPCAFGLAGLLAGMLVWRLDQWQRWTLLDFQAAAATALVSAIVAATLTFLGTAFAVLLVVVQYASIQLTPRALRVSLSDPLYRVTLGLFVGTFAYSMTILARITPTFIPQAGVSLATILVVASLVAYLILISHLRSSLRPVIVAARVGRLGRRTIERTYPSPPGSTAPAVAALAAPATAPDRILSNTGPPGILVAFDATGLVAEARRVGALVILVPSPGDFVRRGAPLFHLVEPTAPTNARRLLDSVTLGQERTLEQDPAFAFRILVDLAIKALSPAINDPTSAVMAIDQLHDLLGDLAKRALDVGGYGDEAGTVRLVVTMPRWEDYVSLAVDEIRRFGAEQLQVMRRLRAMFDDLAEVVPDDRAAAIQAEVALLDHAVRRAFPDADDQARAREPDGQGIGSPPRSVALRRNH
jgi:uncharacterized membrane protein